MTKKNIAIRVGKIMGFTLAMGVAGSVSHAAIYQINGAGNESINSEWDLVDGGDSRTIFQNNDRRGSSKKPSFFYTGAYSGRSLKLEIQGASSDNASASEKTEYAFVTQTDPNAFPVARVAGSTHYYTGFAVRLGDHNGNLFDPIFDRLMIYQAWQGGGDTSPGFNPPMSFQLKPGRSGSQRLQIWVKNTTHTPNNDSSRITFGGSGGWAIAKGAWYKFIITARAAWPNDGASTGGYLKVWRIDSSGNESALINKDNYDWGYKPGYYGGSSGVNRWLTSTFNIYRAKQTERHQVNYDSVKHSTTKSSATP